VDGRLRPGLLVAFSAADGEVSGRGGGRGHAGAMSTRAQPGSPPDSEELSCLDEAPVAAASGAWLDEVVAEVVVVDVVVV
jgi:hypothetical protein